MECIDYREQFISFLSGNISQAETIALKQHLEQCTDCSKAFEETARLWNLLGELHEPEPAVSMKQDFEEMLSEYKTQLTKTKRPGRWTEDLRVFISGLLRQPAFSFVILFAGITAGYLLHQPSAAQNSQIDSLSSQITEMKQIMMLSMLQDQSASRRIQAVSYTNEMTSVNKKITDALFTTLNEDSNVNVRLATLEALAKMADDPIVREGLIRSIELQDSPIMQSAIADIMVKLHEKKSVRQLQKLLERNDINHLVKTKIEKSIKQLI